MLLQFYGSKQTSMFFFMPQMPKFLATIKRSNNLCFFADVSLLWGRRAWVVWSCPHSPAALGRHSQSLRGQVMHVPGIPAQDWAPQTPEVSAWLSPLAETCPGDSQGDVCVSGEHITCCSTGSVGGTTNDMHFAQWNRLTMVGYVLAQLINLYPWWWGRTSCSVFS